MQTLKTMGYDVPVVEATDPEVYGWLQKVNSMGASALVLGSLPQSMWREPEADVAAQSRRMFFENSPLARVWVFSKRIPRMHRHNYDGPVSSSSIAFAWFVWDHQHCGPPTLGWLK